MKFDVQAALLKIQSSEAATLATSATLEAKILKYAPQCSSVASVAGVGADILKSGELINLDDFR
ncbi:MAG: hypothetical protein QM488_18970 [Rhizobiaceae bacterium]